MLAGQHAACKRVVGIEPDAERAQGWEELHLHLASDGVVHALVQGRLDPAIAVANVPHMHHLPLHNQNPQQSHNQGCVLRL